MRISKRAFTLIELIVVISIIAIMASVASLTIVKWLSASRDVARQSNLEVMKNWLEMSLVKKSKLPFPDDYISIAVSWDVVGYQWYFWSWVAGKLTSLEDAPIDGIDKDFFTYYVDESRKKFQLMAYLEDVTAHQNNKNVYAVDYLDRYPRFVGNKLGIMLLKTTNAPLQTTANNFEFSWNVTQVVINLSNNVKFEWPWVLYYGLAQSMKHGWYDYSEPVNCPTWFIPVPWNVEFAQPGFCVAKYEMKFVSTSGKTQNANRKTWQRIWTNNIIISKPETEPIANLTQQEAIDACKSMWEGYHMITNNEWMAIARDIENVKDNWTNWTVWDWGIFRWNTNGANWANSLWCNGWSATDFSFAAWDDDNQLSSNRDTDCNKKRQLKLSNWEIIWDLAWNVGEHVNGASSIDWTLFNIMPGDICWIRAWYSWYSNDWQSLCSYQNGYTKALFWPSWNYNANNWVWRILSDDTKPNVVFLRGGNWQDVPNAGLFTLFLDLIETDSGETAGFRCAR